MPQLPVPVRLPGVYFDIRSTFRLIPERISPGVVIAMIPFPWYIENTPVDIHKREFYDVNYAGKLGFTAFDFNDPHNKKASALTAGAEISIVFPQYTNGTAATGDLNGLDFEAARLGEAGNTLRMNIVQTDDDYSVVTFFGTIPRSVDVQQIRTWNDFVDRGYVKVPIETGGGYPPVETGMIIFDGGDNGDLPQFPMRMGAFLESAAYLAGSGLAADIPPWTTIAFSSELTDTDHLQARSAFRNWLNQQNIDHQDKMHGVIPIEWANGIDNDDITQVDQEIELNNEWYTIGESVLYRAGYHAGSLPNHNETNDVMLDMTNVRPLRNRRQRENAIRRGIFSYVRDWDGRYKVEDDVNSFVSLRVDKNLQWTSNRVGRTLREFMRRVHRHFNTQFKGHVDNTLAGRLKFRAVINQICEDFVTFSMMDEHDIEKIHVLPGAGPRTWRVEFHDVVIVDSVRDSDFNMSITWSVDVEL